MPTAFVYIARCADDTLYIGYTTDIDSREQTYNEGCGGSHTARRRPIRIVYSERHETVEAAIKRERQLKGWALHKKLALIAGNLATLKQLSRRRRPKRAKTPREAR